MSEVSSQGSDDVVGAHRETHRKLAEDIESLLGVHQEFAEGIKDFPRVRQKLAEGIESLLGVRQTKMIGSLPRWRREFAGRRPRDSLEDHQGGGCIFVAQESEQQAMVIPPRQVVVVGKPTAGASHA
ncbi:hypothetical protein BHE74_00052936 [Ensete ventricosum]|nr:hypothetical protein BHE74_00052936 [Ensete ventricosum]